MFWRYNETTKLMDPDYPHHIRRWRGVPADLDAATTWTDGKKNYIIPHYETTDNSSDKELSVFE